MTIFPLALRQSARLRLFGLHDYQRCYVLPEQVETNIPRRGSLGEVGSWDYARGVLVEVSRHLGATPVAVHYRELETGPARLPVGIEVTAAVRDDIAQRITVISRRETAPYGARGDYWQLTVNGVVPDGGLHSHPPSLPWLANLVRLASIRDPDREDRRCCDAHSEQRPYPQSGRRIRS